MVLSFHVAIAADCCFMAFIGRTVCISELSIVEERESRFRLRFETLLVVAVRPSSTGSEGPVNTEEV